jgi:hypothetical protein
VHSVSEVGASAFTLLSTRDARKDILSGATQIRRLGDEEEDDATQAPTAGAGEKPPPPYPRAMLAMDVSDGRTALRAIEYRRMQGLVLGETPLGIKVSTGPSPTAFLSSFLRFLSFPLTSAPRTQRPLPTRHSWVQTPDES